ncbi:phage tail tape measure protein [Pseudovibrio sp. Tun.PSC04-5.I4]|uniref:phage tail tape measure protein n=1 Tax=Pseudovibrio sp. Tun.PSC04-5.I4 TaxID=1798213 RepID=UPI000890E1DC|nr:phage tail tape measure protein [Pseudovibrio sp. Tun.PSC04-5.I4]SDR00054.1 phage tail tape measure protein, TP901 family, core region [Pseudovibrio sp. Tun.PSC04-5.I4]
MSVITSQLILALVDRVTAPARAALRNVEGLRRAAQRNSRQLASMRGGMLEAAGVGYVLARALSSPIKAAMSFESAMADVRKVVDFDSPDGFKIMSKDIRALAREIPISAEGIASMVAAAGQAGMGAPEALEFAKMAGKIGVAFEMSADVTGESLAKIKTALGLTVGETGDLADALNHLSNTSASSAPDLLNYMRRVGSVGLQYGFTAEQTAAIGSAMIAAGSDAEVAATSFRNVGKALARGEGATKRQRKAYRLLGLDAVKVSKHLQKDAVGTLKAVIGQIRKLPKELQASTMTDLFGDEARAIAPLIENADLLTSALGSVAEETNYLGSAQSEYEARAATTASAMQRFKNQVNDLGISIGSALLPALTKVMETIGPFINALADLAAANPEVTAAVVGLLASLVGLRVAVMAARFSFLWLTNGALNAALGIHYAVGMISTAMARLRAMFIGAWMMAALGGGGFWAGLITAVSGAYATVMAVVSGIIATVTAVTAPVWGLIALIVAVVASIALAIYNYWEPISNYISGFASVIWEALLSVLEALGGFAYEVAAAVGEWATQKLIDFGAWLGIDEATMRAALDFAITSISESLSSIVETVKAIPAKIGDWISEIFTMNDYSDEAEAEFHEAGEKAGKAIVTAIKNAFNSLFEWFSELPDRILKAIGNIDVSSLISWPSPPSWLPNLWGGAANDNVAQPKTGISGARALGGQIVGGRSYLVGENGAEVVTPSQSGYVHTASDTANMAPGGGAGPAGGSQTFNFGDLHFHETSNASEMVDEFVDQVQDRMAGLHADQEYAVR